jgi:anti-sigma regulatory factor (Ser/Thr protein kinase)
VSAQDTPWGLEVEADEQVGLPFRADEVRHAVQRALARSAERQRTCARAEVCFRLRSDPKYLEELNELLANLFHSAGLSILQVQQLTLAVRELGANAIEWGHQRQPERIVTVACRLDTDKVAVVVRDSGPGFNPADLPHAASADDPLSHMQVRAARKLREGGFGILMARGLVDELRYNEAGNEARLVMYLASARARNGDAHNEEARSERTLAVAAR